MSRHASPRGGFLFHTALRFFEIARLLMSFDHVAPELDGSLRRGRLTSSPPQFGQTKYICSAQLAQYVHS
jgi:hypothetical protein